jgi:hypothetical protein
MPALADETSGCVDTWPDDRKRPTLKDTFPLKGTAGHVAYLSITVDHLPGEQVFPAGIRITADSEETAWLRKAQFQILDEQSAVKPVLTRSQAKGEAAQTKLELPFLLLPKEPGRRELTLPRLPVSVARASGQVHTLCTAPHVITVDDPLASVTDPKQHPDPEPRPQLEVWTFLRDAVLSLLLALPIAIAIAWLFLRLRKKWKKVPKPPPPRPPWELALAELRSIEGRNLLKAEKYEEFLDAVSDTLRHYLGERYGFEGLESTTRETLRRLAALAADFDEERAVRTILQRADLVKFARRLPEEEECRDALAETRRIIQVTTPAMAKRATSGSATGQAKSPPPPAPPSKGAPFERKDG